MWWVGAGMEVRHHVNLFGIHTVCAYIVLFHHFMARLTLVSCGPPEKPEPIATPDADLRRSRCACLTFSPGRLLPPFIFRIHTSISFA